MEDIKQAVILAQQFLSSLVEDATAVRLEEVEPAAEDEGWLITLSFVKPADSPLQQFAPVRVYKQFHVEGGKVRSMKIRELAGA